MKRAENYEGTDSFDDRYLGAVLIVLNTMNVLVFLGLTFVENIIKSSNKIVPQPAEGQTEMLPTALREMQQGKAQKSSLTEQEKRGEIEDQQINNIDRVKLDNQEKLSEQVMEAKQVEQEMEVDQNEQAKHSRQNMHGNQENPSPNKQDIQEKKIFPNIVLHEKIDKIDANTTSTNQMPHTLQIKEELGEELFREELFRDNETDLLEGDAMSMFLMGWKKEGDVSVENNSKTADLRKVEPVIK